MKTTIKVFFFSLLIPLLFIPLLLFAIKPLNTFITDVTNETSKATGEIGKLMDLNLKLPDESSKIADIYLISLCIWREARGESFEAKRGVAWTLRNRVQNPRWWGKSWHEVITKPLMFSSFNKGEVNSVKFPDSADKSWLECVDAATEVYAPEKAHPQGELPKDPTNGATHYYDKSLDKNPPSWAKSMQPKGSIGALRFFKEI